MAYINWIPEYDLGIAEMDRQHRRLVEIVNRLHDSMEEGCPRCAMQGVLSDLVTYTEIHFSYEERLMERLNLPDSDSESHHNEHRELTRELKAQEAALAGGRICVSRELMGFLKGWLLDHVVHADRTLADHALGLRIAGGLTLCS